MSGSNSPDKEEDRLFHTPFYESRQESPSNISLLQQRRQQLSTYAYNNWEPSTARTGHAMNQHGQQGDSVPHKWMNQQQQHELSPGDRSTQNIWSTNRSASQNLNDQTSYGSFYPRPDEGIAAADTSSSYFGGGSIYSGGSPSFYGGNSNSYSEGLSIPRDVVDTTTASLSRSIGHLNLGSNTIQPEVNYYGGGLASVPTMASGTTSSIPGVIGASSGSTGGGSLSRSMASSSTWGYPQQQQQLPPRDRSVPSYFPSLGNNSTISEPPGFPKQGKPMNYAAAPFPGPPPIGGPPSLSPGMNTRAAVPFPDNQTLSSHNAYSLRGPNNSRKDQEPQKMGNGNQPHSRRNDGKKKNRTTHHEPSSNQHRRQRDKSQSDRSKSPPPFWTEEDNFTNASSKGSSAAIRMLMNAPVTSISDRSTASSRGSGLTGTRLPLDDLVQEGSNNTLDRPILPSMDDVSFLSPEDDEEDDTTDDAGDETEIWGDGIGPHSPSSKKKEWLLRMNRRMQETAIGSLDPATIPVSAIMNAWAKTKSAQGAGMVEMWLERIQEEVEAGNTKVVLNTKLFTMAVDAWAKSGEGGNAARKAESILQNMNSLYQKTGYEHLRPTTGIFNAVINAWARSKEKIAPSRAEQILEWMDKLRRNSPSIQIRPDKFTYNTVIHAYAKSGGTAAATKAQELLARMHSMNNAGNHMAKPDTITYNVVINAWAKSGGKGAALEAEKLLAQMHTIHQAGDRDIKPNVVTYGAVIDSYAKSGEKGAAAKADTLLAQMIKLYQSDPVGNRDLQPNTYVFNTVINCWAKSKEPDAASKAEEMLLAMSKLHASGMPNLKPDAFTYTAVIDAWSKSGFRGAAARADQLLDKMEAKFLAGDNALRPNSFTYNAVINALAKSGEPGAAARAERVLENMVNRHRQGAGDDCRPTTINFNTILDAWAKSGGGRQAAQRAEEILEWMDRLHKGGNAECQPDTISFNAVIDAWARSGDRMAPHRAEQILDHMDELYRAGDKGKKPDVYSYNTLINAWAKSQERGSAARAEHVLRVMKQRYSDGDNDFKPNTRTMTSVIDAWAKSGEKGAAKRAEQILNSMIESYEISRDPDTKPNVYTANTVCNACAFTKDEEDKPEALQIAYRVFKWLSSQADLQADAYTYTNMLSVCSNLLPRADTQTLYSHAKSLFDQCCARGYVNERVLQKLRQTVTTEEYMSLTGTHGETSTSNLPTSWTRSISRYGRVQVNKGRKKGGNWQRRRK